MCLPVGYSSLERVCLPVGGLGYSSKRVRFDGCAYQLVGMDTVLSGRTCAVLTSWLGFLSGCAGTGVLASWAWIQF